MKKIQSSYYWTQEPGGLKSSVVVLGLVKLIDAKGIDVAQLIWP